MRRANIALMMLPLAMFAVIGAGVSVLRQDWRYGALFGMLGLVGAVASQAHRLFGRRLTAFRRLLHWALALFFFGYLMMAVGVNFHLSQVFFDALAWVAAGALIQLAVARVLVPFFFGNGFCSTCCWNGAVFDLLPHRGRRELPPWTRYLPYAVILGTLALVLLLDRSGFSTSTDAGLRRSWVLAENGVIFAAGLALTPLFGSRAYCRAVCPFHAISRLFAGYSVVKVGPKRGIACERCGRCQSVCPFHLPVAAYAAAGERVRSSDCILCERCVAACPQDALQLTIGWPWE